jgi:hypothetical protein
MENYMAIDCTFKMHGMVEVQIKRVQSSVHITKRERIRTKQCDACFLAGEKANCENDSVDREYLKEIATLYLDKSEARAIASAIMGAAAEI